MVECDPIKQTVIYGDFGMVSTVVTEFNLVCKEDYKVGKRIKKINNNVSFWRIKLFFTDYKIFCQSEASP